MVSLSFLPYDRVLRHLVLANPGMHTVNSVGFLLGAKSLTQTHRHIRITFDSPQKHTRQPL